jgi:hypothetical protein
MHGFCPRYGRWLPCLTSPLFARACFYLGRGRGDEGVEGEVKPATTYNNIHALIINPCIEKPGMPTVYYKRTAAEEN